ncbi:hypothetical protein JOC76_005281 [Neobacillus cucumis]|nr:hypothetical protein [Neobacillus cucumis]
MEENDSMYGIERKSAILELLNKNARVDVQQLSSKKEKGYCKGSG